MEVSDFSFCRRRWCFSFFSLSFFTKRIFISMSSGGGESSWLLLYSLTQALWPACRRGGAEDEPLSGTERVSCTATFSKTIVSLTFRCLYQLQNRKATNKVAIAVILILWNAKNAVSFLVKTKRLFIFCVIIMSINGVWYFFTSRCSLNDKVVIMFQTMSK